MYRKPGHKASSEKVSGDSPPVRAKHRLKQSINQTLVEVKLEALECLLNSIQTDARFHSLIIIAWLNSWRLSLRFVSIRKYSKKSGARSELAALVAN